MAGAFVVSRGHVVAQFVHQTAADRPDCVVVAQEGVDHAEFQDGPEKDGVGFEFQGSSAALARGRGAGKHVAERGSRRHAELQEAERHQFHAEPIGYGAASGSCDPRQSAEGTGI